jgi:hypothetical protein
LYAFLDLMRSLFKSIKSVCLVAFLDLSTSFFCLSWVLDLQTSWKHCQHFQIEH